MADATFECPETNVDAVVADAVGAAMLKERLAVDADGAAMLKERLVVEAVGAAMLKERLADEAVGAAMLNGTLADAVGCAMPWPRKPNEVLAAIGAVTPSTPGDGGPSISIDGDVAGFGVLMLRVDSFAAMNSGSDVSGTSRGSNVGLSSSSSDL